MRSFEFFRDDGRIREVSPRKSMAESLLSRAEDRLNSEEHRELKEENAFLVLENIYESLRETIEAGMAAEGFKSSDHVATIAYADEKLGLSRKELGLSRKELEKLHRFRKLRNNSRYEAEEITVEEAKDILGFAEKFIHGIKEEVETND